MNKKHLFKKSFLTSMLYICMSLSCIVCLFQSLFFSSCVFLYNAVLLYYYHKRKTCLTL